MRRHLAIVTIATLMCATAAYSADDAQKPAGAGADTSTGAKEQSSAPAGSAADKDMSKDTSAGEPQQLFPISYVRLFCS